MPGVGAGPNPTQHCPHSQSQLCLSQCSDTSAGLSPHARGAHPTCHLPELGQVTPRDPTWPRVVSQGWRGPCRRSESSLLPCRPAERGCHDGRPVPADPQGTAHSPSLHPGPTAGLQDSPGGLHEALCVLQADPPPLTCSSWSPVLFHVLVCRLEGGKHPPDPFNFFFFPLFFTFWVPTESLRSPCSFVWKCCREEAASHCGWGGVWAPK